MSEFAESPEQQPIKQRIESAAEYLQGRLREIGSFEQLILAIQHDYTGNVVSHSADEDTTAVRIMGEPLTETPLGSGNHYEDANGAGQLYQLLRIAEYLVNADATSPQFTNAFYAGELVAMTVIDYVTTNENNAPSSVLASLSEKREETWVATLKEILDEKQRQGDTLGLLGTSSIPTTEQSYVVHQTVAQEARRKAYEFSFNEEGSNNDAKELLHSLLHGLSPEKIILIETGYGLIMREWLDPEHRRLEQTFQAVENPALPPTKLTRDALVEAAKRALNGEIEYDEPPVVETMTTTAYDEEMAELELQFSDNELDYDVAEWNRQSLDEMVRRTVYQSMRIRAATSLQDDETNPAVATKLIRTLSESLNAYIRNEYEIDEDDLVYAHGTFVALANSMLPLAQYDENGVLISEERQFAYQAISENDYRAMLNNPEADIVPFEVRGSFDKIVITKAVSDKESYTTDIDDVASHEQLTFDSFVPAIRLLNVSIVDMRQDIPVEHVNDMIIPLTHSHLQLGRFVPPLPESE